MSITRQDVNQKIKDNLPSNNNNGITAEHHRAVETYIVDYVDQEVNKINVTLTNKGEVLDYTEEEGIKINLKSNNNVLSSTTVPYASTTNGGIMSKNDKTKLDGIEAEANKTVVDSALNASSINPVQNQAIVNGIDAKILEMQKTRFKAYTGSQGDYDTATGTWKMYKVNGNYLVTDITAAEMEVICAGADFNTGAIFSGAMRKGEKTNRPVDTYRVVRGSSIIVDMRQMARGNTSLQVFYIPVSGVSGEYVFAVNDMIAAFMGCENLRIVKYLDVSRCASFANTFTNCSSLEECYLKGVDADLDLSACIDITRDSIIYIVENAGTKAKNLYFPSTIATNWNQDPPERYEKWEDFEAFARSIKNFIFNTNTSPQLDLDWEQ